MCVFVSVEWTIYKNHEKLAIFAAHISIPYYFMRRGKGLDYLFLLSPVSTGFEVFFLFSSHRILSSQDGQNN